MYAESIVNERVGQASERLGFQIEYHSIGEIATFDSQLQARYPDEYDKARAASQGAEDPSKSFQIQITRLLCNPASPRLTAEEVRIIQNERALAMCDAAYFLTRYYKILDRENLKRNFAFQAGQRILFDIISEMELRRIAIEIILAKARQLGMTTEVVGLILQKVLFSDGVGSFAASADRDKTKEMASKIFDAYDGLPWWLRPLTTKRVESDSGLIQFAGTNSKLIFQHGKQVNPIAMGTTPIAYLMSEVSSFPNPEKLIETGLFKCVHPSPRIFGVLESTCKGDSGWWHDTYWHSKDSWESGESRLMALFLPFYCGTDMYPNETWLRRSPIPENWRPDSETEKMISESEFYVSTNPLLSKVLKQSSGQSGQWKMPKAQAWYWEQNWKEHKKKGAEKTWFQEMPHTDRAAFVGSYDNVFGRETIAEVWSTRRTSYGVYMVKGQSIELRHEPQDHEIDYSERIIPVEYASRRGPTYRWELWPVLWEEPFATLDQIRGDDSHMGKLFVWHPPEPGYDYALGIDTSNGIGSDATCIAVNRRGRSPQEQDVQAAEFRSNRVSHVEAYAWAMAIAAYYARYMEETTPLREPYAAIEQIAAVGDTCQLQMSKMGYGRFHIPRRYDSKPKAMRKANSNKRGFFTTGYTRPILTDGFVIVVQNGWYKVNSPYTIREMTQWEVHYTDGGKSKFEHAEHATDDGIFANALSTFAPNDTAVMAERSQKQFRGSLAGKAPAIDLTPISSVGGIMINPDRYGVMSQEDERRLRGRF